MNEQKVNLVATIVMEIARKSTHKLLHTHPEELMKFISKEKTIKGIENQTKALFTAAVMFIMKTLETCPMDFEPQDIDDGLTAFLVEFMEKRS